MVRIRQEGDTLLIDSGLFRSELLPVEGGDDAEAANYVFTEPPLLGFPLVFTQAENGDTTFTIGRGTVEYTFEPAQGTQ
jgi:hypothetical protein